MMTFQASVSMRAFEQCYFPWHQQQAFIFTHVQETQPIDQFSTAALECGGDVSAPGSPLLLCRRRRKLASGLG